MNSIHKTFEHGTKFKIGNFCVIEEDVIVGDNVSLGHHVVLKSGTRMYNNIDFADYCKTTGLCIIGNDVNVRTGACISKSVIVEDKAFIGPDVMTNHTKHVPHCRNIKKEFLLTIIGYGSIIGSNTSIIAGVYICPNTIVGAGSVVTKDINIAGIYFGCPAETTFPLPSEYKINGHSEYYEFSEEDITKYLPYLKRE